MADRQYCHVSRTRKNRESRVDPVSILYVDCMDHASSYCSYNVVRPHKKRTVRSKHHRAHKYVADARYP